MATSKRVMVGGGSRAVRESKAIPESKVHRDPKAPPINWDDFTINGLPVPEKLRIAETLPLTDQRLEGRVGTIHEREVADIVNRRRVTRDQDDKRLDKYRDGLATGNLLLGKDPLEVMAERHTPEGHRHLWIGAKKAQESGLIRGVVEYKPVMIPDEKDPSRLVRVEQNGMFLASVPEHIAEQADRYYAQVSDDKLENALERVREQSDQIMHEGGMRDAARRRRQVADLHGLEEDDSDAADRELERAGLLEHETADVGD